MKLFDNSNLRPISTKNVAQAFILMLALSSASAQQSHPTLSRLQSLEKAIVDGEVNALTDFLEDVKRIGSPLIEPSHTQNGFVLVTFIWQGSPDARNVRLLSGPQFMSHYKSEFSRLAGTDIWYLANEMPEGLRMAYKLSERSADHTSSSTGGEKRWTGSDPLNLRHSEYDPTLPPSGTYDFSIFETPNAPPEPWLRRRFGIQAGALETVEIPSGVLGANRKVQIYRPKQMASGESRMRSIYLFDGASYSGDMHVADVLDNLIDERRIEPIIAILVSSPSGRDRDTELQCDPIFAKFVTAELVPWVQAHYPVSRDPRKTTIGGFSLGGLAASYIAGTHPAIFGNVLAQSPSLWWQPKDVTLQDSAPWITRECPELGKPPMRIYVSVGRDEPTIIEKARVFRDTLRARGCDIQLNEISGQHDPINWRLTLPDGLIFLNGEKSSR